MNNDILNEKLRELRKLKRLMEDVQHHAATIEDEVKSEMQNRGVDEIITDDYKVTWKTVVSTRLDTKALKEERPEIYTRYAKEFQSKRFMVS